MTGRPRSCGSATVLPSARRSRASAAGAAPWSAIRFSPARRSSRGAPATGAAASRTSASAAVRLERIARNRTTWGPCRGPYDARVIEERHGSAGARGSAKPQAVRRPRRACGEPFGGVGAMSGPPLLMTNTGSVDRLADVERRQVELELRVLHGVGGQHVGSERRHAPLHPLAHVPDVVLARAPRRRVPREAPRDVAEKPAAQELVG